MGKKNEKNDPKFLPFDNGNLDNGSAAFISILTWNFKNSAEKKKKVNVPSCYDYCECKMCKLCVFVYQEHWVP